MTRAAFALIEGLTRRLYPVGINPRASSALVAWKALARYAVSPSLMSPTRVWPARLILAHQLDLKNAHALFVETQSAMAFPMFNTSINYHVARQTRPFRSSPQ